MSVKINVEGMLEMLTLLCRELQVAKKWTRLFINRVSYQFFICNVFVVYEINDLYQ